MRNVLRNRIPYLLMAATLVVALGCQQPSTIGEGAEKGGESAAGSSFDSGSPEQAAESKKVTLEAGTPVKVRTTSTLSTKSAQSGETFIASLEEALVAGGRVIAPKGATVRGTVAESDPGGKVQGVARLAVRLTQIETADGGTLDISTSTYATQAKTTKKQDAKKVGIGSGVGAAIGAIAGGGKGAAIGAGVGAGAGTGAVLATRGDPAVIPSESVITFTVR